MKRLFLVVSMVLIFVGCNSDDSSTNNSEMTSSIIGEWKKEKSVRDSDNHDQNLDYCELQNTVEFTEDGYAIHQNYYLGAGGDCYEQDPSTYSYSVNGNILTLIYELHNDVFEEEILKLTETTLIIRVNRRYSGPISEETYTVTYTRVE